MQRSIFTLVVENFRLILSSYHCLELVDTAWLSEAVYSDFHSLCRLATQYLITAKLYLRIKQSALNALGTRLTGGCLCSYEGPIHYRNRRVAAPPLPREVQCYIRPILRGIGMGHMPGLLTKEEIKAMRPKDRELYIEKALLNLIRANSDGLTASDLQARTKFYQRTVRDHLDVLVARGEVVARTLGKSGMSIYYPRGEPIGKPTEIRSRTELGKSYLVFKLASNGSAKFYVQERIVDSFGGIDIKGGIYINESDVLDFVKSLHTIASRQERGTN